MLEAAAAALKCRPAEVGDKVAALQGRFKDTEKALAGARKSGLHQRDYDVVTARSPYGDAVIGKLDGIDAAALRGIADELRPAAGAIVLASVVGGKVVLLASGSPEAVAKGFDAGALVAAIAPVVGGRGGGKPQMAQAGGPDTAAVDAALDAAREFLKAG